MSRAILFVVLSVFFGCSLTAVGFLVSSPAAAYVVAPGVAAAFWLCSGKAHEVSYAVLSIGLNCLLYSLLGYLMLRLTLGLRLNKVGKA